MNIKFVNSGLTHLLHEYETMFEEGLQAMEGLQATLVIQPDTVPKFCKPRLVGTHALQKSIEKDLQLLVGADCFETAKTHLSAW